MVSPAAPLTDSAPAPALHRTALTAVVSVQTTTLSALVKQASLTVPLPEPSSVTLPAQVAPEETVKPPIGLHELSEVGGSGGCGETCRQPSASSPAPASAPSHRQRRPPSARPKPHPRALVGCFWSVQQRKLGKRSVGRCNRFTCSSQA